jgi:hypothetical protein
VDTIQNGSISLPHLDYMLKIWHNRDIQPITVTTTKIIQLVTLFDELLPFIVNKDIYSKDYSDLSTLKCVVENAELVKDEKSFVQFRGVLMEPQYRKYSITKNSGHHRSCIG